MSVMKDQSDLFKRIAVASFRNIIGFGAAVLVIAYLAAMPGIKKPALILAAIVVLIMITTINALIIFTFYTIRSIPETMKKQSNEITFSHIYGFTLAAISLRLIETGIYIYYIVYMYKLFF